MTIEDLCRKANLTQRQVENIVASVRRQRPDVAIVDIRREAIQLPPEVAEALADRRTAEPDSEAATVLEILDASIELRLTLSDGSEILYWYSPREFREVEVPDSLEGIQEL